MRRAPASRPMSALIGGAALVAVLAGCTGAPQPAPSPSATVAEPTASAPASAAPPALVPDGTAAQNLPYFTQIVQSVWAGPQQVQGRAYVDALTAAGFDKAAMQVTQDTTTVGNPAESIQFSVRWSDACLIGQVGPATGSPVTVVEPVLQDGTCLVGTTRPIDW